MTQLRRKFAKHTPKGQVSCQNWKALRKNWHKTVIQQIVIAPMISLKE